MILFTIAYFLLHWPLYSVLHILFLEAATENYSLKLNKISLKVAGYKPATFLKLNPSQVIFKDFLLANIRLGEGVLKTCWRCLKRNSFLSSKPPFKTSSWHVSKKSFLRRLEEDALQKRLEFVFGRWEIVTLKMSSRLPGKQEMFAGLVISYLTLYF